MVQKYLDLLLFVLASVVLITAWGVEKDKLFGDFFCFHGNWRNSSCSMVDPAMLRQELSYFFFSFPNRG